MYFLLSGRFYTRGRNIRQYELGKTFLFRLVIVCRLLCVGQTFLFRVGQTFLFRLVILVIVCRCPPRRMLLIPGTGNGERGTGNGSLGTSVQRQPS